VKEWWWPRAGGKTSDENAATSASPWRAAAAVNYTPKRIVAVVMVARACSPRGFCGAYFDLYARVRHNSLQWRPNRLSWKQRTLLLSYNIILYYWCSWVQVRRECPEMDCRQDVSRGARKKGAKGSFEFDCFVHSIVSVRTPLGLVNSNFRKFSNEPLWNEPKLLLKRRITLNAIIN
jgi:hypothetical protein